MSKIFFMSMYRFNDNNNNPFNKNWAPQKNLKIGLGGNFTFCGYGAMYRTGFQFYIRIIH